VDDQKLLKTDPALKPKQMMKQVGVKDKRLKQSEAK